MMTMWIYTRIEFFFVVKIILIIFNASQSTGDAMKDFQLAFENFSTTGFPVNFLNSIELLNQDGRKSPVSSECLNALNLGGNERKFINQFLKRSGYFPPDFRNITYADFGDYDGCLNAKEDDGKERKAKYCLVSLIPDFKRLENLGIQQEQIEKFLGVEMTGLFGQSLRIGLCLQNSCSHADIDTITGSTAHRYFWTQNIPSLCEERKSLLEKFYTASFGQKISCLALIFLILNVCLAGFLDLTNFLVQLKFRSNIQQWHHFFSPKQSYQHLISPGEVTRLKILDHLRFFAYLTVFTSHIPLWPCVMSGFYLLANFKYAKEFHQEFWTQPISNVWFLDILLFLGGLSATLQVLTKSRGKSSFPLLVGLSFERFIRYQPMILAAIAIEMVLPLIGSGPAYQESSNVGYDTCSRTFWYNILHLNNLLPLKDMCLPHLWSMASELQMFIIALPFLSLFMKKPRLATVCTSMVVITGLIYKLSIFQLENIMAITFATPFKLQDTFHYFHAFYAKPMPRLWSYLWSVGLFMIILLRLDRKFPQFLTTWYAIITMLVVCGYSSLLFNYWKLYPKGWNSTLFNAVISPLFMFSLSCIVLRHTDEVRISVERKVVIVKGEDRTEKNQFQELEIDPPKIEEESTDWRDIGLKLGRSGYFCHQVVLFWYYATQRKPMEWWSGEAIYKGFLVFLSMLFGGFVFHMFVTSPWERIYAKIKRNFISWFEQHFDMKTRKQD
ncbi:uncharacterized protein LOC141853604 [Brevipalpus obovatus]|uniref:uncharacterized protein LOC141853604 n=1 Tax=Brevipalpus obovatus TaxID=246614 RepID=UPI003D9DF563